MNQNWLNMSDLLLFNPYRDFVSLCTVCHLYTRFLFFRDTIGIKLTYSANFMDYSGLSTWSSDLLCDVDHFCLLFLVLVCWLSRIKNKLTVSLYLFLRKDTLVGWPSGVEYPSCYQCEGVQQDPILQNQRPWGFDLKKKSGWNLTGGTCAQQIHTLRRMVERFQDYRLPLTITFINF